MTNWPTKKLGEIIKLQYGKGIEKSDRKLDGKYPIYGANGILGHSDRYLTKGEAIIVGRKGSAGEITRASGKFWPSDVTYYVFGSKQVNVEFLFYSLKNLNLKNLAVGVKPGINRNRIYELEIPLPPLKTQKKIVEKLEQLTAQINHAKKLRTEAQENTANLLPAALHKIFEEEKQKKWGEKTIDNLALQIKAGFACAKSNEVTDGVVHLRTHNIDLSGEVNLQKTIRIPESMADSKIFNLRKGDILFNNTNSAELVGKTAIVRKNLPYAFSNHLTRIRLDTNLVMPEWIITIFQKYWREKIFENMCTRWVGQAGINQTALKNVSIPLPPLPEQKKIVAYLDSLSEKITQIQALQTETLENLKQLEQSILHHAFTGKLIQ
jgi:type I restriction enzyme, S subunit